MRGLEGKVAYVTGGAGGIGRGIVDRLVDEGVAVVIGDVDRAALEAIRTRYADRVDVYEVDVTDGTQVQGLVDHTVQRFGRLDIAVNNAVAMDRVMSSDHGRRRIWDQDPGTWLGVADGVLSPVLLGIQCAATQMLAQGNGGSIINTSSIRGSVPGEFASYGAAKAAVDMLVRSACLDLGGRGIRVNAVAPGLVLTEALAAAMSKPGAIDTFTDSTPLGRAATPSDIAAAVAFLASDDASFITGQTVTVDGGLSNAGFPGRSTIHDPAELADRR